MRKLLVTAIALVVLAALAGPAVAARDGGGRVMVTISFAETSDSARTADSIAQGDAVSFAVDPLRVKDRDLPKLWVANVCRQNGEVVYLQHLPVTYPSYRVGLAGVFMLEGDTWTSGAAECTSYVWMWPDPSAPLTGASLPYAAQA